MKKKMALNPQWPVLNSYDRRHVDNIALPLGGLGTGTVSLSGRGDLRDWEIMNRYAKGFSFPEAFFVIRTDDGKTVSVKALEGPLPQTPYNGVSGHRYHGFCLPHFREVSFHAAYPLAQIMLADRTMPVAVRLEAFNPLVPGDAETSGIPIVVLRYVVKNISARPVAVGICGSLKNFIGHDGCKPDPRGNKNSFRKGSAGGVALQGIFMQSKAGTAKDENNGTIALAALSNGPVTYRTSWLPHRWGAALRDFWEDFTDDARLEPRTGDALEPVASLAIPDTIKPGGEMTLTFLIAWHFPNRYSWVPCVPEKQNQQRKWIGNYYATRYADAWDVVRQTAGNLPVFEEKTVAFVKAVTDSSLPHPIKEAALNNVSTLRTQTCFRAANGFFHGFEGSGCCWGSCSHVWNYEQTLSYLFGDLSRSMRVVEFLYATDKRGLMCGRIDLPLERAQDSKNGHADGQMGALLRVYRDWQFSGDDAFLARLWPTIRKAMEFCWIPGGWDADRDGVMEGCQHNTHDIEWYGPNPLMTILYLGALRAVEEMARRRGETDFANRCRDLFHNGSRWVDGNLFNGDYYEQKIGAEKSAAGREFRFSTIGDEFRNSRRFVPQGAHKSVPELQLGAGLLSDQLFGQCVAHLCGLGYLLDKGHIRTTLSSIAAHNFRQNLYDTLRPYSNFFMHDDEAGLLVCSFPHGNRPVFPFPYGSNIWPGIEYIVAATMILEGRRRDALRIVAAVRKRFDGAMRNPFNEMECGDHYVRSMSAWALLTAWTGFRYSGIGKTICFTVKDGRYFWSNGQAWGVCDVRTSATNRKQRKVVFTVLHGEIRLKRFSLSDETAVFAREAIVRRDRPLKFSVGH